jgi:hypothetical protein
MVRKSVFEVAAQPDRSIPGLSFARQLEEGIFRGAHIFELALRISYKVKLIDAALPPQPARRAFANTVIDCMPSVGTARVVGSIAARARGIQERQRAGGAIQVVVAAVQTFWNQAPHLEAIII